MQLEAIASRPITSKHLSSSSPFSYVESATPSLFSLTLNIQLKKVDSKLLMENISYSQRNVTVALRWFCKV